MWRITAAEADVEQLRTRLEDEYGLIEPQVREHPTLQRSMREQFNLAVDATTGLIESGALGAGPYTVTLTGHATADHGQVEGERQFVSIDVSGATGLSSGQPRALAEQAGSRPI